MTYNEIVEVSDIVFDEYLPKVSAKLRKVFMDALLSELEERGGIELEDDGDFVSDDEDVELPE